jgi:membrane protease YdiL (CAAX protease family)
VTEPTTTELPTHEPIPLAQTRKIWGWVALALLFAFLITNSLSSYFSEEKESKNTSFASQAVLIRQAIVSRQMAKMLPIAGDDSIDLKSVEKDLRQRIKTNATAAALLLAVERESGQKPNAEALKTLKGGSPTDRTIAQVYEQPKLVEKDAVRLADRLADAGDAAEIAAIHARESAGLSAEGKGDLFKGLRLLLVILGAVFAFVVGLILLICFFALRWYGEIHVEGHPLEPLDGPRADRVAIRAFQMICLFIGTSLLLEIFTPKHSIGDSVSIFNAYVLATAMIGGVILLFRFPIYGQTLTLRDVGLTTRNFGRNVSLGVAAYFANLPILLVAMIIGQFLLRFLPPAHHPATDMLMQKQSFALILSLFVQASVMAPFWEEICFRGLIFPALTNVTGRTIFGALISSFLFAAIHPQGIALWFGLGSIGFMSCVLAKHTKSLVPSITMHAVHNGLTLLLSIMIFQ